MEKKKSKSSTSDQRKESKLARDQITQQIPDTLFDCAAYGQRLNSTSILIFGKIRSRWSKKADLKKEWFSTIRTLARECNCSQSTIRAHAEPLSDAGYLLRSYRLTAPWNSPCAVTRFSTLRAANLAQQRVLDETGKSYNIGVVFSCPKTWPSVQFLISKGYLPSSHIGNARAPHHFADEDPSENPDGDPRQSRDSTSEDLEENQNPVTTSSQSDVMESNPLRPSSIREIGSSSSYAEELIAQLPDPISDCAAIYLKMFRKKFDLDPPPSFLNQFMDAELWEFVSAFVETIRDRHGTITGWFENEFRRLSGLDKAHPRMPEPRFLKGGASVQSYLSRLAYKNSRPAERAFMEAPEAMMAEVSDD